MISPLSLPHRLYLKEAKHFIEAQLNLWIGVVLRHERTAQALTSDGRLLLISRLRENPLQSARQTQTVVRLLLRRGFLFVIKQSIASITTHCEYTRDYARDFP
uniref:DUF4388 domain-containing protein n=1 Tax=Ascaris lumbricoides TaxID=6252 RepID=A0A0M3HUA1_ASCLU